MDRAPRAAGMALADIPLSYLRSVVIKAYHLDITLNTDMATYTGLVSIVVDVKTGGMSSNPQRTSPEPRLPEAVPGVAPAAVVSADSSTCFYLHADPALKLSAATVNGAPAAMVRDRCSPTHILRIEVPEKVAVCGRPESVIEVQFAGCISQSRTDGLFEAGYTTRTGAAKSADAAANGERTIGTHLEPSHARELFPCVDIPSAKAIFHLTLRGVPRHLAAISNTPVLHIDDENGPMAASDGGNRLALKTISFQPTPVMPTYVFGFWIGNFHCVSTRAFGPAAIGSRAIGPLPPPSPADKHEETEDTVRISVHVVKGVGLEGAEFALDLTKRAFELFSELFSVQFPLPKLDLIGLPHMHGLGMENFGAITCLQDYLLVTADTTFVRRRRIARLICHEVSHMWYGDIVTPESFDELWLKEGMARFLEYVAVDSLDPSYGVWNNFMTEVFFQAMLADSQDDSHPVVQQHNGDIASIIESFDTITYCKGASVLRMLSHCVSPDRFLEGLRAFVVAHQYGCATMHDLWRAVQGVCDRDGLALSVESLMQPWLTQPKFPMLRVRMVGSDLTITQQPYTFFPLAQESAVSRVDSTVSRTTDEAAHKTCQEGARGGSNEDAGARSLNMLPTSTPVPSEQPVLMASTSAGADGGPAAESFREEARPAQVIWPIPLRIRAARGSPRTSPQGAAALGVDRGGGKSGFGSNGRPGEETHDILMAEPSTSVALSTDTDPGEVGTGKVSAEEEGTLRDGDRSQGFAWREWRPYLVVNYGHHGFFTVQYECERSWELALTAVDEDVLTECEAMGFVHDLILPLHEAATIDRKATSLILLSRREGPRGNNSARCDVICLFARLEKVVQLLGRDRGHPAWSTGQNFIWELLIMCASDALGEFYELSRSQHKLEQAKKCLLQDPRDHRAADSPAPNAGRLDEPALLGDAASGAAGPGAQVPEAVGSTNPPMDAITGESSEGADEAKQIVAAAVAATGARSAAARRLHGISADVELAIEEAEGHVQWYADQLTSGVQQASEFLETVREMRDRLKGIRPHLKWAASDVVPGSIL